MPIITFLPDQKTVTVAAGVTIAQAAEQAGVTISLPCAGKGVCGKCLVKIAEGDVDFQNPGLLSEALVSDGYVLACRSTVCEHDVTIEVISKLREEKGSFTDVFDHLGIDQELLPAKDEIEPLISWIEVQVAEPEMLDGLSDYDRFYQAVNDKIPMPIHLPLNCLSTLPDVLRSSEGKVHVAYHIENGVVHIVTVSAQQKTTYGIAVDIGTTTVATQLVDVQTGQICDNITQYNAQIDRGMDVISRISYAKNRERVEEMQQLVLSTINTSLAKLMERNQMDAQDICSASIAANTTMVEMLLGITPDYIRLEPYTPAVMGTPTYTAGAIGIEINRNAPVIIAPNVGSYVGGDITAGLLCTDLSLDYEEFCLFIDIGTNGEIVFGNNEFMLSCACSAGPAFEGGGIEKGMRASEGAIEAIEVDPQTGEASYTVIGGGEAKGICGSGLISLIAQLFESGLIDSSGKFNTSGKYASIVQDGRRARYDIRVAEKEEDRVYITEADIDNLIRAKAAIFSACAVLLNSVGMDFDCLSKIYIAGGFGSYIDIDKAQIIGLLPEIEKEKFQFIGNSSLAGAFMMLVSQKHREKEQALAEKMTYIDLSTEASYMDAYISAMFLPHTDEKLFRSRGGKK